jgi:hypothetical protein
MICNSLKGLVSGFRRDDGKWYFWTFCDGINREPKQLRFFLPFLPACALHADRHEFHD